jgi:hypothetical protein
MFKSAGIAVAVLITAAPAAAQERNKPKEKSDPNRIVCQKQEETGWRLGRRKVCHTVAEWAEIRRLARQAIEGKHGVRSPDPDSRSGR